MADQWDTIDAYNRQSLSDLAGEARLDAADRAAGTDTDATRPPAPAPAPSPTPAPPHPPDNGGAEPAGLGRLAQRLGGQRIPTTGAGTVARLANLPMPGGIGMLVFALVVFLFIIVPVNGTKTRMELIWLVLTGAYKLPGDVSAQEDAATADAAAAGFLTGVQDVTGLPATQLLPPITPANAYSVGAALSGGFNTGLFGTLA